MRRIIFLLLLVFLTREARATTYIMCIGDSITTGFGSSPSFDPCTDTAAKVSAFTGITYTASNHGQVGTTSADWTPTAGNSNFSNVVADITTFGAANIAYVIIMLGTNDSQAANQWSASTYTSNMEAITAGLISHSITKILINQPPWIGNTSSPWNASSDTVLQAYIAAIPTIVAANPTNVFLGNQTYHALSQANPNLYLNQNDFIHPAGSNVDGVTTINPGYAEQTTLWANAIEALSLPTGPWAGIVDPWRMMDWSAVGISGGIPSAGWSQCVNTQCTTVTSAGTSVTPAQIVSALTNAPANTYVKLAAGNYSFSSGIIATGINNVELRGAGPTQTKLAFTGTSGCSGGNGTCGTSFGSSDNTYSGGSPTAYNWTAGYSKGATQITVASSTGITANNTMIILDQCEDGYTGTPCSGTAVDNSAYYVCSAAENPSANASQTVTITNGTVVTGTGFSASYGNAIVLTVSGSLYTYPFGFVSSTKGYLGIAVSNGTYTAAFPTGCSYNAAVGAARPHRYQQEMTQVTACSPSCNNAGSTVLTLGHALQHPNWASGQSPQIWYITPSHNVGITNLSIDGAGTNYAGATAGIGFNNLAQFWVKNVALTNWPNITLWVVQSLEGDLESNYFYASGQSSSSTDNSAINMYGSHILVTNNLMHNAHLGVIFNGPCNGDVVSYNGIYNSYTGNSTMFGAMWPGHSDGSDYNLIEGNDANFLDGDNAHGAGMMNTSFRNFWRGWESCANGNCGSNTAKDSDVSAALMVANWRYHNFVANVMGTPSVSTAGYTYTNPEYFYFGTAGYVYNLGSGNSGAGPGNGTAGGPIPVDEMVIPTTMRWANYDAFNAATQYTATDSGNTVPVWPNYAPPTSCTSGSPTCPASFYLSSRPSWWKSSIPFPAIGPDVSSGNVGQCTGTANTSGQFAKVAATNSSQCTGTSLTSAWAGHVNAIPALACALSLGMPPDGTGSVLSSFDANSCYVASIGGGGSIMGGKAVQQGSVTR